MTNTQGLRAGILSANVDSNRRHTWLVCLAVGLFALGPLSSAGAGELLAGAAKVDITHREAGPVNDPLYAKALVLKRDGQTAVIITVDAVAIENIGSFPKDYLARVRKALEQDLAIPPTSVLVNASHCHGIVCADVTERTIEAVKLAARGLVPVKAGVGTGNEDRIMENRRLRLKSGREADVRHAYSLPPDEEVASVGPIDPEIGILRLDRLDGRPLAVVYNFACHPIQGVPSGANTADIVGFASHTIEENLGDGALALFLQGCGGDVNPVLYKDIDHPRDAEPLGTKLGLSTLAAIRQIETRANAPLQLIHERLALPRADLAPYITAAEAEAERLAGTLRGTSLNLKTFLQLAARHGLAGEFPSYDSHRYLHETARGRGDLARHDAQNRQNMKAYLANIYTMEELTRVQTNLALLKMHHQQNLDAGSRTLDVELAALRVGDFVLTTFPGELTVRIGLNLKERSPHKPTFVAGYTNGYIYYAPTEEQLKNRGRAQEDSDCLLAPEWQKIYEAKALELLSKL
jgi:hypothetical protein